MNLHLVEIAATVAPSAHGFSLKHRDAYPDAAAAFVPTLRGGSWEAPALAGRGLSTLGTNRAARRVWASVCGKDLCYVLWQTRPAAPSNRSGHGVSIDRFVAGLWRQLAAVEVQHEQPNRRR
jgi:hypothetical protein